MQASRPMKMAFNPSFSGPPMSQDTYRQISRASTALTTDTFPLMGTSYNPTSLDPSVQSFHPDDMAVATLGSNTHLSEIDQDVKLLRHNMNTTHMHFVESLRGQELQNLRTTAEMDDVKYMVGRDLQTLQGDIRDVKSMVQGTGRQANNTQDFSKKNLSNLYRSEAADLEYKAANLRQKAIELVPIKNVKSVNTKLFGNGWVSTWAPKGGCLCCSPKEPSSVGGNLEHTNGDRGRNVEDVGTTTPTPMRRRIKAAPTKPVEITKPADTPITDIQVVDAAVRETEMADLRAMIEQLRKKNDELNESKIKKSEDVKKVDNKDGSIQTEQDKAEPLHYYMPHALHTFPSPPALPALATLPVSEIEEFSHEFLVKVFGGAEWSPGFYFSPKSRQLTSKSYWLLDAASEPFLPASPGLHGAKLTAFFNDTGVNGPEEEHYSRVPVFIKGVGADGYRYFGMYSQTRFSDKVDYERMLLNVPVAVREFWAEKLADPRRPEWVTKALMKQLWPRPTYEGPISASLAGSDGDDVAEDLKKALFAYAQELQQWEKDAKAEVDKLTKESLLDLFTHADADAEPGLRLWLEYFENVGFDEAFYNWMENLKLSPGKQERMQIGNQAPIMRNIGAEVNVGKPWMRTSMMRVPREAHMKMMSEKESAALVDIKEDVVQEHNIAHATTRRDSKTAIEPEWKDNSPTSPSPNTWDNSPPVAEWDNTKTTAATTKAPAPVSSSAKPSTMNGDLEAAEAFLQAATKAKSKPRTAPSTVKYVPPHQKTVAAHQGTGTQQQKASLPPKKAIPTLQQSALPPHQRSALLPHERTVFPPHLRRKA